MNNDESAVISPTSRKIAIPILISVIILSVLAVLLKDEIKSLFKPSKDNHEIVVPKKSPSKPEQSQPAEKKTKNSPVKEPGASPLPNHDGRDNVEQKEDTGKGLKVSLSGKRIKIKATITKVKSKPAEEKKQMPAGDSTKTDAAPPQNLD